MYLWQGGCSQHDTCRRWVWSIIYWRWLNWMGIRGGRTFHSKCPQMAFMYDDRHLYVAGVVVKCACAAQVCSRWICHDRTSFSCLFCIICCGMNWNGLFVQTICIWKWVDGWRCPFSTKVDYLIPLYGVLYNNIHSSNGWMVYLFLIIIIINAPHRQRVTLTWQGGEL